MKSVKNYFFVLLGIMTIGSSTIAGGDSTKLIFPEKKKSLVAEPTSEVKKLESAHFTYNTGKVYVTWLTNGDDEDGVYMIERSVDGENYAGVGYKTAIPTKLHLLFCWIDENPSNGTAYYKLSKIQPNGIDALTPPTAVVVPQEQKIKSASIEKK